jgi:hypothetical protein
LGNDFLACRLRRDRLDSFGQLIWMMVSIGALKHLEGHAKVACRRPEIDGSLHQPGRRGVAQRVRCDVLFRDVDPRQLDDQAADLIGQLGDPMYSRKANALFCNRRLTT